MPDWPDDNDFDFGSMSEQQQQQFLFEQIFGGMGDQRAHDLFWDVMYNDNLTNTQRQQRYEELTDYYREEYNIDFDAVWDWADFREWYAAA